MCVYYNYCIIFVLYCYLYVLFCIILLQEMESTFTQLNSARVYIGATTCSQHKEHETIQRHIIHKNEQLHKHHKTGAKKDTANEVCSGSLHYN